MFTEIPSIEKVDVLASTITLIDAQMSRNAEAKVDTIIPELLDRIMARLRDDDSPVVTHHRGMPQVFLRDIKAHNHAVLYGAMNHTCGMNPQQLVVHTLQQLECYIIHLYHQARRLERLLGDARFNHITAF